MQSVSYQPTTNVAPVAVPTPRQWSPQPVPPAPVWNPWMTYPQPPVYWVPGLVNYPPGRTAPSAPPATPLLPPADSFTPSQPAKAELAALPEPGKPKAPLTPRQQKEEHLIGFIRDILTKNPDWLDRIPEDVIRDLDKTDGDPAKMTEALVTVALNSPWVDQFQQQANQSRFSRFMFKHLIPRFLPPEMRTWIDPILDFNNAQKA